MSNVVAIIQARMGSTRLPGKVAMEIVGKTMLWHIINRVKRANLINKIVVATTTEEEDKVILALAQNSNVEYFTGSEEDVLDRYYQAAKKYRADVIVRITADDPFKDPIVIDKIIEIYLENENSLDYVSNTLEPTYPEGLDIEVFSFSALERAWKEAKKDFEREHVTPYIWTNPDKFRLKNVINEDGDFSHLRWTVDTKDDLDFVREVYHRLYKEREIFLMHDILNLLEKCPELRKINKTIKQRLWLKKD